MPHAARLTAARAIAWADDRGPREEMEDGWAVVDGLAQIPTALYAAVYDGHGGRSTVDFITNSLHEIVVRTLRQTQGADMARVLEKSFAEADRQIQEAGVLVSGATACAVMILPNATAPSSRDEGRTVWTAHLGDSRAVLCRGGKALRLTSVTDHRATDPLEAKRVVEAGGFIANDRVNGMLAMSRALGDNLLKMPHLANDVVSNVPDVSHVALHPSDEFIVIACDGLFDVADDDTVVQKVIEFRDSVTDEMLRGASFTREDVIARALVEFALSRGTQDNVTVMLIVP